MSETYQHRVEREEHELALPNGLEVQAKLEAITETAGTQKNQAEAVAEARQSAIEAAKASSSQDTLKGLEQAEDTPVMTPSTISRELKSISRRRELKNIRAQESRPERTLSRVIHQPFIRAASEAAGNTVTRPSGLLGGGLLAFIGSGSYFILAKYVGFTYNYTLSLAFFVAGFALGLVLELLVHWATASRRQLD